MRGQTTLDFALGVTLFVGAIIFTFTFAPTILTPFETSGQQDTITADRVADQLSQGLLGHPASPYVLDRHCTVAFFDRIGPDTVHDAPARCRYGNGTLTQQLGLGVTANVNISLVGDLDGSATGSNLLYWNESNNALGERPSGGADEVVLAAGESPPIQNDATVSGTRVVSLAGHDVTMRVVVW